MIFLGKLPFWEIVFEACFFLVNLRSFGVEILSVFSYVHLEPYLRLIPDVMQKFVRCVEISQTVWAACDRRQRELDVRLQLMKETSFEVQGRLDDAHLGL